jgi:hypothetical protein
MKRTASKSKAFAAYGYDPKTQTLEIQYHSDAIYQHKNVPETLFQAFEAAPSLGAYLNGGIKPAYPAERQADAVTIWVCGHTITADDGLQTWELQGLFAQEKDAVLACRDATYFVAPETLDVELPVETVEWVGRYYPLDVPESEERDFAPND